MERGFAGRWVAAGDLQVVGIHSALLPNGQVMAFGYKDGHHFVDEVGRFHLWDPVTRQPSPESTVIDGWNPFCAGHSFLGDGRFFIAGGFKFGDPFRSSSADKIGTVSVAGPAVTWKYKEYGKMEDKRWYPSVVTLPNGDALIIGGSAPFAADNWKDLNEDYEYFSLSNDYLVRHNETRREFPRDGGFAWPEGDPRQRVEDGKRLAGLYPLTHVLPSAPGGDAPNGILFLITESFLRLYNPSTNRILWRKVDVGGFRTWWTQASSVLLPIDVDADGNPPAQVRVLVVGGGTLGKQDPTAPARVAAEVWRYTVADRSIAQESTIPLHRNRFMGDSILLPDGNVVVVGGAESGYTNENSRQVRFAELIRPARGDTVDLAEASQLRGYHASALLLPDGAVFVTGGTGGWANAPVQEFKSVEVFEPPYLALGGRPRILEAPATLERGQPFSIDVDGPAIEPVIVLLRNNSRTHSLDTDQRMLRLRARVSTVSGLTKLTATVPVNATVSVPGPYLIFALSRAGDPGDSPQNLIPSIARQVLLGTKQFRPPLMVSRIRVTITTGGDDLRGGNNNAFASFLDQGGGVSVPEFALNRTARWADHTVNTVTRALTLPVPLDRIRKLKIRTTFGGGIGGDNWNIDRLIVDYDTGSGWLTLYDEFGSPLARLTGDHKTWSASL